MSKSIVFFEVEGGNDKGPDGHRKDTLPMVEALKKKGWNSEAIYYSDENIEELFNQVSEKFDGYVSRVNPGSIPGGEEKYYDFLRRLSDAGLTGMPHPDTMITFGSKDSLVHLRDTDLVPNDTYLYKELSELKESLPKSLAKGERVLKQNRGSTGSGIWRVVVEDERDFTGVDSLPLDTKLRCTEAVDNHVENHTLGEFMDFCSQYVGGHPQNLMVDMTFLPRIKEGEIRILMVGKKPVFVVHKKPAEGADAFSATLFSGAKYTYDAPEKWATLTNMFLTELPKINETLGVSATPLLWTADFILADTESGEDGYVLGEINCSCVGFTSHLDQGIQDMVADEIMSSIN